MTSKCNYMTKNVQLTAFLFFMELVLLERKALLNLWNNERQIGEFIHLPIDSIIDHHSVSCGT